MYITFLKISVLRNGEGHLDISFYFHQDFVYTFPLRHFTQENYVEKHTSFENAV